MPPARALALHGADRLRARRRPPVRPDPPRHQARERPDRRRSRAAGSRSPTSAWPRRSAPTPSTPPPAASSSARSPTSRPSSSSTAPPTRAPTCTPRAWSSTSCSPARSRTRASRRSQVAYKHVHEDVPPPSRLAPGIPRVRRRARRPRHRPRPRPATGRRRRPAPPAPPGLAGPGRWGLGRRGAHLRPRPSAHEGRAVRPVRAVRAVRPSDSGPVTEDTNAFEILPIAEPFEAAAPATPLPFEPQPLAVPPSEPPVRVVTHPHGPRRSRRGPVLLAVALAIAVAAGLGAYWFGWARYTATPGVIGLTQQAATTKLDHAGLDVKIGDPSYSEDVAKGRRRQHRPDTRGARARPRDGHPDALARQGALLRPEGRADDRRPGPGRAAQAAPDLWPVVPPLRRLGTEGHGPRQQPARPANARRPASRST